MTVSTSAGMPRPAASWLSTAAWRLSASALCSMENGLHE